MFKDYAEKVQERIAEPSGVRGGVDSVYNK